MLLPSLPRAGSGKPAAGGMLAPQKLADVGRQGFPPIPRQLSRLSGCHRAGPALSALCRQTTSSAHSQYAFPTEMLVSKGKLRYSNALERGLDGSTSQQRSPQRRREAEQGPCGRLCHRLSLGPLFPRVPGASLGTGHQGHPARGLAELLSRGLAAGVQEAAHGQGGGALLAQAWTF